MKAVILKAAGGIDQLQVEDLAVPSIKEDEILIKTQAFSINPIEVKTRKGNRFTEKLLADTPSILGWDGSGIVEKIGSDIEQFKTGDRVFGIIGFPNFGKTYAEYFVAKEKDLVKIPTEVSFEEAAVSTIAALTAYQALTYDAQLKPGKKILIHAASGGVGHFGVQIAKYLGAEIYATASARNKEFVLNLGADHFIDYNTQVFEEEVQDMDVVFDLIGGPYIDRSLKTLKPGGTLISIPSATNEKVVEKAEANGMKGVRFIMKADQKDLEAVAQLLKESHLKPVISEKYKLSQIKEAHQSLEDGHTRGKIVVMMD